MTRPLRIEYSGAYYHVMNRGLACQPIYQDEKDRELFLNLLGEVHARWDLQIYGFSLMSNQYHLCVQTPTAFLSRIMRHIDGVYTQKFNRRHKREGPLFRGRYKAILIEKDPYLLTVIRYIHRTRLEPCEAGHSATYRFNSSHYYLSEGKKPFWLDTRMVFDSSNKDRLRLFNLTTEKEPLEEGRDEYQPECHGPLLGSEEFKQRMRLNEGFKLREREIPERRYLAVAIRTCVKTVAAAYGINEARIKKSLRGKKNEPRQVAMYLCREAGGYRHREIAEALKAGSYSTVSSACALLKKRMEEEKGLNEKVKKIHIQIMKTGSQLYSK